MEPEGFIAMFITVRHLFLTEANKIIEYEFKYLYSSGVWCRNLLEFRFSGSPM